MTFDPILPCSRHARTALAAAVLCAGAASAASQTGFSGRWRMDTTSIKGNIRPTVIRLVDGGFRKDGNEIVRTDGRFHPVATDGYVDEISISVETDHIVKEVDRVRGKLAYIVDYIVSADGNKLTWHIASYTNPNGQPVRGVTVQRRVGRPTKAAHLVSGTWQRVSVTVDAKSDWILKLDGNRFSWRTEAGTGYDAIIGGKPVAIDGDNSGARALIARPRPDTIVETDLSKQGKSEAMMSMQLLPDGKTIRGTARSRGQRGPTIFYLHRIAD